MTLRVMKASFWKLKPKVIHYRNDKRLRNESYGNEQVTEFSKQNFEENSLEKFLEVCKKTCTRHAFSFYESGTDEGNYDENKALE